MALLEGGGGAPTPTKGKNRFDKGGEPRWTPVPKSKGPIPGTRDWEGGGGGGRGRRFEPLTPYTPAPPETPAPTLSSWQTSTMPNPMGVAAGWRTKQEDSDEEKETYTRKREKEEAERAEQRERSPRRTFEMSWDRYNRLNAEQRAAVDFNTLLVGAREKDLNADYEETPQQRASYDKAVNAMFGEEGGSEVYAPETLAVLRQIDFEGSEGDDLDDFLGLQAAITAKDLKGFSIDPVDARVQVQTGLPDKWVGDIQTKGLEVEVLPLEARLAQKTQELQESMAKANQLMNDFRTSAGLLRNEDLSFFGGELNEGRIELGFGSEAMRKNPDMVGIDEHFQNSFLALALRQNDANIDQVWADINGPLRPKEKEAFVRYVDARTSQAGDYGLKVGDGKQKQYRSPEEIRQLLGLDEAGD